MKNVYLLVLVSFLAVVVDKNIAIQASSYVYNITNVMHHHIPIQLFAHVNSIKCWWTVWIIDSVCVLVGNHAHIWGVNFMHFFMLCVFWVIFLGDSRGKIPPGESWNEHWMLSSWRLWIRAYKWEIWDGGTLLNEIMWNACSAKSM